MSPAGNHDVHTYSQVQQRQVTDEVPAAVHHVVCASSGACAAIFTHTPTWNGCLPLLQSGVPFLSSLSLHHHRPRMSFLPRGWTDPTNRQRCAKRIIQSRGQSVSHRRWVGLFSSVPMGLSQPLLCLPQRGSLGLSVRDPLTRARILHYTNVGPFICRRSTDGSGQPSRCATRPCCCHRSNHANLTPKAGVPNTIHHYLVNPHALSSSCHRGPVFVVKDRIGYDRSLVSPGEPQ